MAKILVIDDELFVRTKLKNFLEAHGHVVFLAESGMKGVSLYEQSKPDLVFCDVMMKGIDGLETLKLLRKHDPNAKVVILSALGGHQATLVQALASGAKDIMAKPYKEEKVLELIKKLTGQ